VLGRPEGFGAARLAAAANAALSQDLRGRLARDVALSAVRFPVGLRSDNGQVVLGRDGHLFLLVGSNGEVSRLGAEAAERARLVAAWLDLIEARRARCAAEGRRFLQLIVPEKASLVPELLPDPSGGGPSPFLLALEAEIAARPQLAACTISGLGVLREAAAAAGVRLSAMVRRLDSHPSPLGMHSLAVAVLRRLGEAPPDLATGFGPPRLAAGDLSAQFLAAPMFEDVPHVLPRSLRQFGVEPRLVDSHVPAEGGHVGRWERSLARGAPSAGRMLAFGNSVCGSVTAGQALLSGWLARWFAGYAFHWQPALVGAVVATERPDVVLCQTVERFMGRVPES
jgi:hypothetical protein